MAISAELPRPTATSGDQDSSVNIAQDPSLNTTQASSPSLPPIRPQQSQLPSAPAPSAPRIMTSLNTSPDTLPVHSDRDLDLDSLSNTSGLLSPVTDPESVEPAEPPTWTLDDLHAALAGLYAENILAKPCRTAAKSLVGERRFPEFFPEYVPQDGEGTGEYHMREADFWTCGFFPGTLFALLERAIKFPRFLKQGDAFTRDGASQNGTSQDGTLQNGTSQDGVSGLPSTRIGIETIRSHLQKLCDIWADPLHGMASRTDTHDIGFIVMPALRLDWELRGNTQSLDSIIRAARSLATRYVPSSGAIRSWDLLLKKNLEITDQSENMILIIDSLCNLDLLYYAAEHCSDGRALYDMATSHASVLLETHLREETPTPSSKNCYVDGPWYSTCHVANIDPRDGALKARLTHQGYADESTWARGQAWGILGYAQTYMSTRDDKFLRAACGLAEYFVHRLETAPACVAEGSRHVPLWDFDAPIDDPAAPLRDSSAGAIAANGMIILSQALAANGQPGLGARYRTEATKIVRELLEFAQAPETARLVPAGEGDTLLGVEDATGGTFEGILRFGTANNNRYSKRRYANHGLVYGDYYLVEFGNKLLRMGLV